MVMGTLLLGLLLFTMLYAMRTLLGMRHRRFYPLIRCRQVDGTRVPLSIQSMPSLPRQLSSGH